MPIVLNDPRFDTVVRFLQMHSGGAGLGQIAGQFRPALPERTLRRLLANMVDVGVLTPTGAPRYRQYHLRTKPGPFGRATWFDPASAVGTHIADAQHEIFDAIAARKRTKAPQPPTSGSQTATSTSQAATDAAEGMAAGPRLPAEAPPLPPAPSPTCPADRASDVQSATSEVARSAPAVASPALNAQPSTLNTTSSPALPATKSISSTRAQAILDRLVPQYIERRVTPDRLPYELRMPAIDAFVLKPGEQRDDLKTLLIAALDTLSIEQAATRYRIAKDTFTIWRELWPTGQVLGKVG